MIADEFSQRSDKVVGLLEAMKQAQHRSSPLLVKHPSRAYAEPSEYSDPSEHSRHSEHASRTAALPETLEDEWAEF